MTKPTQMEKLEEIVRALERFHSSHPVDHNFDRALTLARELRDNAVERWMDREDVEDADGPYWWIFDNPETTERATHDPDPLRVLLITDPNP